MGLGATGYVWVGGGGTRGGRGELLVRDSEIDSERQKDKWRARARARLER